MFSDFYIVAISTTKKLLKFINFSAEVPQFLDRKCKITKKPIARTSKKTRPK